MGYLVPPGREARLLKHDVRLAWRLWVMSTVFAMSATSPVYLFDTRKIVAAQRTDEGHELSCHTLNAAAHTGDFSPRSANHGSPFFGQGISSCCAFVCS